MSYQIELRHLHYFQVLGEELNFHRASEKLFISQPGLSRQIKQMEEIFGVSLFDRSKRKVELTEAGSYLLKEVDFIFSHLTNIKKQVINIHQGKLSELRIGFLGSAAQKVIPEFVAGLNKEHPGIRTILEEMPNKLQLELLQKYELDIGFVRMKSFPAGISSHLVHRDTFSIVLPLNHPLKSATFNEIKKLKDEPFIFFSSDDSPHYFDLVMSICEDHGFRPTVFHKSINALTIFKLIEEGMGVAILPTSLQHGYDLKVKFIELNHIKQKTELYMVWKEQNRNPSLVNAVDFVNKD
jgi:DNA-binding transcriptional LysR family regulator